MEHVDTFSFPEVSAKERRFLYVTTGAETPEIPEDDQELDLDSRTDEAVQSVDDLYSNLTPEQKRELYERLRTEFETEEEEPPVNEPATAAENGAEPLADESAEGQTDVLTDDLRQALDDVGGQAAQDLRNALEMGNAEDAETARATLETALQEALDIGLATSVEQVAAWVQEQFPTFEGVTFDGTLTIPEVPGAGEGQKPEEAPAAGPAPMPAPEKPKAGGQKPAEKPAAAPAPMPAPERPAGEGGGAAKGAEKAPELTEAQKKAVEYVEAQMPLLESTAKRNMQDFQGVLDQLKEQIKALPKEKADEIRGRLNKPLGENTPPREIKVEQDGTWKVVEKAKEGGAKAAPAVETKDKEKTLIEEIKEMFAELIRYLNKILKGQETIIARVGKDRQAAGEKKPLPTDVRTAREEAAAKRRAEHKQARLTAGQKKKEDAAEAAVGAERVKLEQAQRQAAAAGTENDPKVKAKIESLQVRAEEAEKRLAEERNRTTQLQTENKFLMQYAEDADNYVAFLENFTFTTTQELQRQLDARGIRGQVQQTEDASHVAVTGVQQGDAQRIVQACQAQEGRKVAVQQVPEGNGNVTLNFTFGLAFGNLIQQIGGTGNQAQQVEVNIPVVPEPEVEETVEEVPDEEVPEEEKPAVEPQPEVVPTPEPEEEKVTDEGVTGEETGAEEFDPFAR
ncbi:hypothetical protein COU79_04735 [Candidatus Peregrinibacteria bacterium CG10_big_fil_rev_8_21_14_0_10_54_7]|nr:MAG: hypothetical protein COU79_04735 [Candidatus Peregrinibacteria bacterium CG10_big_fil_rev_8_21_14_0_10_54_7]